MSGKIKSMLEKIIEERSKGNPTIALTTKTKILLKGINPDQWTNTSSDDPQVIAKIVQIGEEFGVSFK